MKKLLFLFAIICALTGSTIAQTSTLTVPVGQSYAVLTHDYTLTNTTAQYFMINAPQNQPTTQDFLFKITKGTGSLYPVTVSLWGQKFATGPWTQISTTMTWFLKTADTTAIISNATLNRYRLYKVIYTPAGTGTAIINKQEFKQYYE